VVELKIRNGIALIDDDLAPILEQFSWHKISHGYASADIKSKPMLMHRFIMGAREHDIVDHINGKIGRASCRERV